MGAGGFGTGNQQGSRQQGTGDIGAGGFGSGNQQGQEQGLGGSRGLGESTQQGTGTQQGTTGSTTQKVRGVGHNAKEKVKRGVGKATSSSPSSSSSSDVGER